MYSTSLTSTPELVAPDRERSSKQSAGFVTNVSFRVVTRHPRGYRTLTPSSRLLNVSDSRDGLVEPPHPAAAQPNARQAKTTARCLRTAGGYGSISSGPLVGGAGLTRVHL